MGEDEATRDLRVMLGDPRKAVIAMTIPLIFSFLVTQVNSFADAAWCSMLGKDAASATATIGPVYWMIGGIGTGLGVGASTAIARHLGARDRGRASALVTQTMALSTVIGIAFTPVFWVIVEPSISMMGADDIRTECVDYILPIVVCTVAFVVNGVVAGTLRAEGAAKRSTAMLIVASVLNIVLDPLFMFTLDLGIAGAGWATSVSTIVSTAVGLYWYARGRMYLSMSFKGFAWNREEDREVLRVAVPRATEIALISLMCMVQRIFVFACAGSDGAVLYNIPWRYVALAQVISQAVGSAIIPIASAAIGQGDFAKAETADRYGMRISLVSMSLIAVLLFVFAEQAMAPLTMSDSMDELMPEFLWTLRIYALCIPFVAVLDIASSVLQSLQLAQISLVCTFGRHGLTVLLLALTYTVSFHAVILSVLAAEAIGAVLMLLAARYEFGKVSSKAAGSPSL